MSSVRRGLDGLSVAKLESPARGEVMMITLRSTSTVSSPRWCPWSCWCQGVLLGLSNTAGVLAGVFGTAATGYILQHGSWDDVFKLSVTLYLIGTVIWNIFSTGEKIID